MTPDLLNILYSAFFGGLAVVTANLHQRDRRLNTVAAYLFRAMIITLILCIWGLPLLVNSRDSIGIRAGLNTASIVPLVCGGTLTIVAISSSARRWLHCLLPSLVLDRPVHLMGLTICLFLTASAWYQYTVSGGMEGLAEQIRRAGPQLDRVLIEQGVWIFGAALGVGLFTRRSVNSVLQRLGLRWPKREDIAWGASAGITGLSIVILVNMIGAQLSSSEAGAEETAAAFALAEQYATLPVAFLVSAAAAVGEEILFRGALQPVFGVELTTLFFVILHIQYAQSFLMIVLLLFTLLLAWLRVRVSTTAAIIAHFVYNFAQLTLWITLMA